MRRSRSIASRRKTSSKQIEPEASRLWRESFAASTGARSFFRCLHQPESLKAHPLFVRLVTRPFASAVVPCEEGVAEEIRAMVLRVAQQFRRIDEAHGPRELADRRYKAFVRCDLERVPPSVVARDLGVSLRQLRREQKIARERIATELLRRPAVVLAPEDSDSIAIDRSIAIRLWDAGMFDEALDLLRQLSRSHPSVLQRVAALSATAEIFADRGMPLRGEAILIAADQAVSAETAIDERTRRLAGCLVEQGRALLQVVSNPLSTECLDRVVATAFGEASSNSIATELLASCLLRRAALLVGQGALERASRDLASTQIVLSRTPRAFPAVFIDFLTLKGELASLKSECESAYAALRQALELSQEHGFKRRYLRAQLILSELEYQYGDRELGKRHAQACVAGARRMGMAPLAADAAMSAASFEMLEKHMPEAFTYLELARPYSPNGSLMWARLAHVRAELELLKGELPAALSRAMSAGRAATALGSRRLHGAALRTIAKVEFLAGERKRARSAIDAALDVLTESGSSGSLGLAYSASAVITGRSQHQARALDLFPNLSQIPAFAPRAS